MARERYQYETSPKKIEPDYRRRNTKKKLEVIENTQKRNTKAEREAKKIRKRQIFLVVAIFATLLFISYRNSVINEEFKEIQALKKNLAVIQKENKQLEISLEGSLNLNNIEKIATEQLGMQKQTSNQTIYTELDKQDYIEVSAEETQKEKKGIFTKILEIFK
jgi:hypothetical protein